MISLIKNELTKIFKKKAIYITLAITLIFVIAINFIYKMQQNNVSFDSASQIEFYEKQLAQINPEDKKDLESYLVCKTELDIAKLVQSYGGNNSWQAQVIEEKLRLLITQMNYQKYDAKNEAEYQNIKNQYEQTKQKLDKNDWNYFAKEQLEEVKNNLEEKKELKKLAISQMELKEIEQQIYQLEVQKQVIDWRLENNIPYGNDYKNTCLMNYQSAKLAIREYETSQEQDDYQAKQQYYSQLERAAISQYDIEHGTNSGNTSNARGILLSVFSQFEIFIIVMIIMIAGSIVSEEFSRGTVKLLLIKPYKRTTILASKLITCFMMLIIVMVIVVIMQFVVGGLIQGFEGFSTKVVVYNHNNSQIQEIGIANYLGMQLLGKLPIYMLLMTLAFCISTIFTNSALAITITLLGYMGAPFINQLGIVFNLKWLKFFVTPNWDLTQYLFGGLPEFEGLTPIFSIAIIVAYMLIMLVPTFMLFKKKNIKNI